MSVHTLISHPLCPYVQRAAIVLKEKDIDFIRRDVDLTNMPAWFLELSPLAKTPVLLVDGEPIFESAVICEFLDETQLPRLHPENALERARHRAWMEFGSSLLNTIWSFYTADDEATLSARSRDIRVHFEQLESVLDAGPYFAGKRFSMVDAVFGPVFRYFDVFDAIGNFGFFVGLQKVQAWRACLAARPSVRDAVGPDYPELLHEFLVARHSTLSRRMTGNTQINISCKIPSLASGA